MKLILAIITGIFFLCSCNKSSSDSAINVEGFWNVQKDTTFTSIPANSTADLYHLFKGSNVFYRFSFPKTQDFSILSAVPRADSMISFYKVDGHVLMLPNPAPSTSNIVPGNSLIDQKENEMTFTRFIITKRNAVTGAIEGTRLDTIRYFRVVDPIKVAYFNNYLKKWH